MIDDDEGDEPDLGRLVAEHWPELKDPREDIYTEQDGLPVLDAGDRAAPPPPKPLPRRLPRQSRHFSNLDDCRTY